MTTPTPTPTQPPAAVPEAPACCNAWFVSLPEGRQAVLRDDKWMLAHAAYEAGRAAGPQQVAVDFPQVGTAGPFPVVNGRVTLAAETMQDLVAMLRPTWEALAAAQAAPRECGNPDCGWRGPAGDAVHPKHDPSQLLCPSCHETTEAAAAAAPMSAQPSAVEALRHSANEWADMATNGLQWLRNVVDGISDPKEALANMERNLAHCRAVNDAPAPTTEEAAPAGEVISCNLDYATVKWHNQTSDHGSGDPKNSRSWPLTGTLVYLAAPGGEAPAEDARPILWGLQYPSDREAGRICIPCIFDQEAEAKDWAERTPDSGATIVPLYGVLAAQSKKGTA